MAYQTIATPRIYLNVPAYLESIGEYEIDSVFRTNPTSMHTFLANTWYQIPYTAVINYTYPYIAYLGHNFSNEDLGNNENGDHSSIINGTNASFSSGFSIIEADDAFTRVKEDDADWAVSSIVSGFYYDFPHAVDLKTTLSYSYEGIKETTTKGGATLSNKYYSGPPKWGNGLGAWELGGSATHAKSGRRVWDISWSFLNQSDIWPDNAGLANEDTNDTITLNLLQDDTIQRVIHICQGNHLPFIFQYDNEVSDGFGTPAPHSFAIAKFDGKFSFQQTSPGLYSAKIRVKEVW